MLVATIIGARPQFVKAAPVSRRLRVRHTEVIIHTGQHYDYEMSALQFKRLGIPAPDHNLGVGSGSHGEQTGRMLPKLENTLRSVRPDWVLIYGDTNSTLAASLAAAKLRLPIAHVEAGMRDYDMTIPEEVNRVVSDRLAKILFCPTDTAVANLRREGYGRVVNGGRLVTKKNELGGRNDFDRTGLGAVVNVGDVMYDAALQFAAAAGGGRRILKRLGLKPRQYVVTTIHRPRNTDIKRHLEEILLGLGDISRRMPVVFPVHPRTRAAMKRHGVDPKKWKLPPSLKLIAPVSYLDMIDLEKSARAIITDSGGVQHEAGFYRVPSVTVLDKSPWTESLEHGWNRLVEADRAAIGLALDEAIRSKPSWKGLRCYGVGRAAAMIVAALEALR